tara:strand:+ start:10 stop:1479 length:1470 start_codon:yes stop_codon:yes gene_type:complete
MFAVPIDNTGLASFVPVRRQSGSSVGLQNLSFDVFGRPIKIRDDDTDIGGTDVGQIDAGQIEQAQVLAPGLAGLIPSPVSDGFDEDQGPQPTINTQEIALSFPDIPSLDEIGGKITGKVEDIIDNPFSYNPEEGPLGTVNVLGQNINIAETALSKAAQKGLPAIFGSRAFIAMPFVDLAIQSVVGKEVTAKDVGFAVGKGLAGLAFGPIGALVVAAIQGLFSFFGPDPVEGPSAPSGDDPDAAGTAAATEGLGIDIGKGIDDYGDFGEDPAEPGPGGYADTGQMGGPTAPDGPSDADDGDDGDDGDAGAPGCWVAGTKVLMADNTYCNIEDLKIGDMVMSFPETKKTRRWNTPLEPQPIISLLVDVHPEIWHLNDSMVSGTEWMIKGDGTAAIVQWLNIGDTVLGPDNNLIEITRVEPAEGDLKKQVIYNFETKFNYSYTANNMRTIRGRAVRAPERGPWSEEYLAGDTNAYEGSMQDEYNKKFNKLAA